MRRAPATRRAPWAPPCRRPVALLLLPACLVGACFLAACSTGRPSGARGSDGFPAPDRELVWEVAHRALRDEGFVPDPEASSLQTATVVTRWRTSLQPFSGLGYREQATVTIHELPDRRDSYTVQTQVVREQNMNMVQPSNPIVARWEQASRVPELESLINRRIETSFLPGGPSPEFRRRYGIDPADSPRIPLAPADDPDR